MQGAGAVAPEEELGEEELGGSSWAFLLFLPISMWLSFFLLSPAALPFVFCVYLSSLYSRMSAPKRATAPRREPSFRYLLVIFLNKGVNPFYFANSNMRSSEVEVNSYTKVHCPCVVNTSEEEAKQNNLFLWS